MSTTEQPRLIKPRLSPERAGKLLWDLYGIRFKDVKPMISYDDLNFHFTVEKDHDNSHLGDLWEHGYTMKVVNSLDTGQENLLESFQECIFYLKSRGLEVPVPVPNLSGEYCQRMRLTEEDSVSENGTATPTADPSGEDKEPLFAVHLLTFIPGQPLSSVPYTPHVLRSLGRMLGRIIQAFQGFSSSVLEKRSALWSLWSVPKLTEYVFAVKEPTRKTLVEGIFRNFTQNVLPHVSKFPQGLIHGDLNEHNLLVSLDEGSSHTMSVSGVLDIGDVHLAPRLFEIAVCLVYPMIGGEERLGVQFDPLLAPGYVLAGLSDYVQLTSEERQLLKPCMEARLAQSVTIGAYTYHTTPGNDYVLDSSRHGWTVLQKLVESDAEDLLQKWDGMEA